MRELDSKVYNVLFANNLNSIGKYEKLRDIVREAYDMGSRDSDKVMFDLLAGTFDDVEFSEVVTPLFIL